MLVNWFKKILKILGILAIVIIADITLIALSGFLKNDLFYQIVAGILVLEGLLIFLIILIGGLYWYIHRFVKDESNKEKIRQELKFLLTMLLGFGILLFYYYISYRILSYPDYMRDAGTAFLAAVIGGLAAEDIIELKRSQSR